MPTPAAACGLSTAARSWAPKRVRAMRQAQRRREHDDEADQEQAIGAEIDAQHGDLVVQRRRQFDRLLRRPPDPGRGRADHEREPDGEQHLVERARAVEAAVERDARAPRRAAPIATNTSGSVEPERHAEAAHQRDAQEAAHHRERAVREVDEVHQAHRHRQAEADQEQQAAVGDTVEEDADQGSHAPRAGLALAGVFDLGDLVELDVVELAADPLHLAHVDVLHDVARGRIDRDRAARALDGDAAGDERHRLVAVDVAAQLLHRRRRSGACRPSRRPP